MQHPPYRLDLSGCSTAEEASAAVAAFIDAAQRADLHRREAAMTNAGVPPARINSKLRSYRRELAQLRAAALARLRGMLAQRDGGSLQ